MRPSPLLILALAHVAEAGFVAQHLLVQPPIQDALPKAPLLPQLDRGNTFLLRPPIDGLGLEAQIERHLFQRQDVVIPSWLRFAHGVRAVSGAEGTRRSYERGASGRRNRDGSTGAALSSPCVSLRSEYTTAV